MQILSLHYERYYRRRIRSLCVIYQRCSFLSGFVSKVSTRYNISKNIKYDNIKLKEIKPTIHSVNDYFSGSDLNAERIKKLLS